MRNRNMGIMGLTIFMCQFIVLFVYLGIALFAGLSSVMLPASTASLIINGTFFGLLNIVALGFTIYGFTGNN